MSREIDERIVEMRFDNKQFESATKETMSTLSKLKQALNLDAAAKGMDTVAKSISGKKLNAISDSLSAIEKRFSAFGTITYRILENAADDIYNKVKTTIGGAINYVTDAIKSGGLKRATNMENAHFQLQALLKDEEKVQAVMADASKSVDGTAYSLDEAAKAASQFSASGIEAGDNMLNALRGIVGVAAMTNSSFEDISRVFTTVAGNGRLMGDQLLQLSSRGLNAASTLSDFFNGVNDGSKEASDSVKSAVRNLTDGLQVSEGDIREWVSKGKISFAMFSEAMTEAFADSAERANETFNGSISNMRSAFARIGAAFYSPLIEQNSNVIRLINSVRVRINDVKKALVFDEEIGNVNALSKQWTDFVLGMAADLADWVDNVDLSKPLEIFYYTIESGKHIFKGLVQALKPIGSAFQGVFYKYLNIDRLVDAAAAMEKLTRKFRVSTKDASNLRRTFKGLFDVVKLVIEGVTDFIKAIIPAKKESDELGTSFLNLTGDLGALLSRFTYWVRESKTLNKIFDGITRAIRTVLTWIVNLRENVGNMIDTLRGIPEVNKFIEAMINLFDAIKQRSTPYVKDFTEVLKDFGKEIMGWDWTKPLQWLEWLAEKIQALADVVLDPNGFKNISDNIGEYFDNFVKGFSFDNVTDKIDAIEGIMSKFISWIQGTFAPVFEKFSFGNMAGGAGALGMIFSLIKISKSLETVSETVKGFKAIPGFFKEMNNTLKAYQKELKAEAILKIAGAIGILSLALIALSFVDTDRLWGAAKSLSAIAGVLLIGTSLLAEATNRSRSIQDGLFQLAKGLKKGIKNLTASVKWKAIGSMVKDMGKAIAYIAASIVGLAILYRSDKEAFGEASKLVAEIFGCLVVAIGVFTLLGEKFDKGMKSFGKAAIGIVALGFALKLAVSAIDQLFGITIPDDWMDKLIILAGVFAALIVVAKVIGDSAREADGNKLPTGGILALAAFLYVSVLALEKIFKMEIPDDIGIKLGIMAGIFGSLVVVILAIGYAGKLSGGAMKAAGTILAMCVFIAVIVAALAILSLFDGAKLIAGAVALGVVLVALGGSIALAAKNADANSAKTVLNMAIVVGTIAASLAVLALFKGTALAKAAVALGSMLLILALDLYTVSKIGNDNAWKTVAAMAGVVVAIAASLAVLALFPISQIAASAIAFCGVLLIFGKVMKDISGKSGIKRDKMLAFLAASLVFIPIGATLALVATQPWENILAAGVALSATLLVFGKVLEGISSRKGIKLSKILDFLAASIAIVPIAIALYELAKQPWDGLLAAGIALSNVLLGMSIVFNIINMAKPDLKTIGLFLLATVAVLPIAAALYILADQPWDGLLAAGTALSEVILSFGVVFAILALVSPLAGGALVAVGVFDLFIASFALILLALGAILENDTTKRLLNGGMEVMGKLGQAIGDFCGNIIGGIGSGIATAIEEIGDGLGKFWENAQPFFEGMANVDPNCIKGVETIAKAVLILTASDFISGIASFMGIKTTSLEEFGAQLAAMAPYIAQYGETVSGIDPKKVAGSAAAIEILATAASNLPRQADWVDKIFGKKQTLAEFGKELEAFAPSIASYAETVKNVDPAVVEASASAAKALSELAKGLPKHGGFLQDFFGDNTMEEFGKDLKEFGIYLVRYNNIVAGNIDNEAIEASANAGKILTELADTVPNSGGVVGAWFGENDIDDFGTKLSVFGSALLAYALITKDINPSTVEGSAAAAAMLVELSNSLENSGGFVSIWTGDNTLSRFGEQLVGFGEGIAGYYDQLKSVAVGKLRDSTVEVSNLGKVIKDLPKDGDNLTNFVKDLTNAGINGINGFLNAFRNSSSLIPVVFSSWATTITNTIKALLPSKKFETVGGDLASAIIKGIDSKKNTAVFQVSLYCASISDTIKKLLSPTPFLSVGQNLVINIGNGMNSKKAWIISIIKSIADEMKSRMRTEIQNAAYVTMGESIIEAIGRGMRNKKQALLNIVKDISRSVENAFKDMGINGSLGLAEGLLESQKPVINAATIVANAGAKAVKNTWKERSPSKLFRQYGLFGGEGAALGLLDSVRQVASAGKEVANAAVDPVAYAVDEINRLMTEGIDDTLTLTPLLDLSQVRTGAQELSSMLGIGLNLASTYDRALAASTSFAMRAAATAAREAGGENGGQSINVEYVQNNYSPKALRRIEIYRDTKNQLATFERLVKA